MRITPMGSLVRGLIAGAIGSFAIGLYLKSTQKMAPAQPKFEPPEPMQKNEMPPETVARRTVEGLMARPLENKETAGQIVHVAFGSAWGGLYGLASTSMPSLRSPLGALGFGTLVWAVSDNVILPAFQLSPWPHETPAKNHAYMWLAHAVYGIAVAAAFEGTLSRRWSPILGSIVARWVTRNLPDFAKPTARRAVAAAYVPYTRARDYAWNVSHMS